MRFSFGSAIDDGSSRGEDLAEAFGLTTMAPVPSWRTSQARLERLAGTIEMKPRATIYRLVR